MHATILHSHTLQRSRESQKKSRRNLSCSTSKYSVSIKINCKNYELNICEKLCVPYKMVNYIGSLVISIYAMDEMLVPWVVHVFSEYIDIFLWFWMMFVISLTHIWHLSIAVTYCYSCYTAIAVKCCNSCYLLLWL